MMTNNLRIQNKLKMERVPLIYCHIFYNYVYVYSKDSKDSKIQKINGHEHALDDPLSISFLLQRHPFSGPVHSAGKLLHTS